jgi:hypothetical protein
MSMERPYTKQDDGPDEIQRLEVETGIQPPGCRHKDAWEQIRFHDGNGERLARALGWFSIGFGLVEVAAPRGLANLIATLYYLKATGSRPR